MRISEAFTEDFSIGLRHDPTDGGSMILLRCPGPHGNFIGDVNAHPHFGFHIHRASAENIADGRRAEAGGVRTEDFNSFLAAIRFFLKITKISWTNSDFPGLEQPELFT